ncbi:MAG: DNA topoisomerase VI subunit B [Rhodospirillales bacterium]|nr:MAG: DNA topoisomerase VI subunit B [Rhodospirillales bacterium]
MPEGDATHPTAFEMAARQRAISVSEFFLKNRHLLGFDSQSKAVVTTVREAVDNALDACEEAGILPEIAVEISRRGAALRVAVEDNGPGIVEGQIGRIFGKLLYGSRFHKLSQSRGQQGMGISAAGMYGQLTTGLPMHIISRIAGEAQAAELHVSIDTSRNRPDIHRKRHLDWDRPHGTRVEVEIEGRYQRGPHSVESYLKQTAIANPHVTLALRDPDGVEIRFQRSVETLPPLPSEIRPHPHGVELGQLIQMLSDADARTLRQFLERAFSRVGRKTADAIIERASAGLSARSYPRRIAHAEATRLHRAIAGTRISGPRTDCLAPIGEERLLEGLRKEIDASFYTVLTRRPAVYRGNPFQVEVGLAHGKPGRPYLEADDGSTRRRKRRGDREQPAQAADLPGRSDEPVRLLRFANRVPLLYQQPACAITRAATQINWRSYGLRQPKGGLPLAPMVMLVHVASVWVPFTSESKEAVASYPEILRELKLGLQDCGRRLARYLRRDRALRLAEAQRSRIETYLPHVGIALQEILEIGDAERERTVAALDAVLRRQRKI